MQKIYDFSLGCMTGSGVDHDFSHVVRVWNLALKIASHESDVDLDVLETACLLHDIGTKFELENGGDHALKGAEMAREFLKENEFAGEFIKKVCHCILSHRYRSDICPTSIEAKILFDADKIDASGAMSVVRGSIWLGRNNADPFAKYYEGYLNDNQRGKPDGKIRDKSKYSLFIDFEVKGKLLPEKMFTSEGERLAAGRVRFYKTFLERLEKEEKGEV